MAKTRKYTNSQLKWLAESLTNSQIAYLLEDEQPTVDASLNQANQNAGLADQPQNPGMQSVDNKSAMKPEVQQTQTQPVDDKKQVTTVCQAIKTGKLSKIEPSQLNSFLQSAKITTKNVATAVKYAIEYLGVQMKNPKNIDMNVLKSVVSGVNNCLGALTQTKNETATAVTNEAKKYGVNIKSLVSNIKQKNTYSIFNSGRLLESSNESAKKYKIKMARLNEQFLREYKGANKSNIHAMNENMLSALEVNSLDGMINEYYELTTMIKNLENLSESKGVKLVKYSNMKKLTAKKSKEINESISAIKFALNFYKENK